MSARPHVASTWQQPALVESLDPGQRRIMCRAMTSHPTRGGAVRFRPETAHLAPMHSGVLPLLLEHGRDTRTVVGVVEAGWLEGSDLFAIARFGHSDEALAAWADVEAGVLRGCSLGNTGGDVFRHPCGTTEVSGFTPIELSLTASPWIPDAELVSHDGAVIHATFLQQRAEWLDRQATAEAAGRAEAERMRLEHLNLIAAAIAPDLDLPVEQVQAAMRRLHSATTPTD